MAIQGMNSSPARDKSMNGAAKPGKVAVGSGHASVVTAKSADGGNGQSLGSAVKGFSSQTVKPGKIKI